MWNAGLDEAQAEIKITGRNINNLRCGDDTTLIAESKEELKSLLMNVKEKREKEEWKSWLKTQHTKDKDHGIQSHHFRTNRWGKGGNSVRFHFHGLQNHCRCWLQPWNKRRLLLGRIAMTNIKKQRHHFANNSLSSQSYGFSNSHVRMWVGPERGLSTEELMLLNCVTREDFWEFFGLKGHQTSQS